jgi:serine protease Do
VHPKVCARLVLLSILVLCLPGGTLIGQSGHTKDAELNLARLSASFETLAQRVSPAVVQIFVTSFSTLGVEGESSAVSVLARQQNTGSGVILDPGGYIVTCAHVVENARRIQVLLPTPRQTGSPGHSLLKSKGKVVDGQVAGVDRETDVAVVKVAERELPFVELADSDTLRQGQVVLAFGAPLGLENSLTMGVVSGVARQLKAEDPMVYVQTDTPINPGNSGGPLIDSNGHVVGINTFILSQSGGSEGVGFAIPSNIVKSVYEQLRKSGKVRRGVIGVYAQTVTPVLATNLGLPQDWGVIISDVVPRGPADLAGMKEGDLVFTLDGKVMENARQFNVNLYRRPIGDNVLIEVLRENSKLPLYVTVQERPDDPERIAQLADPVDNLVPKLGILAVAIDPKVSEMLPPRRKLNGVVVAVKLIGVAATRNDLQTGDVIYSVNRAMIKDVTELNAALNQIKSGGPLLLQIERRGQVMYQAFELE